MKKLFPIALLGFVALHSASAIADCGTFNPAWQGCAVAEDCTPAVNACGWPTAYNSKFTADAAQYNKCIGPFIDCPVPPEAAPVPPAPVCKAGLCEVEAK